KQFQAHLDVVARLGFTTVSINHLQEQLHLGRPMPPKSVCITFDDGFEDFYTNASPQLSSRDMRATLYVVSGMLGGRSQWLWAMGAGALPMLSAGQLREVAD